MIWNYEDLDKETHAINEWKKAEHEEDIFHIIDLLENLPKPCEPLEDCQSHFLSYENCECQRSIFDNKRHQEIYLCWLKLYLEMMITDIILRGYVQKKNHENN